MDDSFHVHLISNVAPHTFPKNNPADFSTPLANEIALHDGDWEVAVRQIMYPTHVATTSSNDKVFIHKYEDNFRGLLPFPPKQLQSLVDSGAKITFQPKDHIKVKKEGEGQAASNKEKDLVDYFLNTVNKSEWQHILKMEYKRPQKKFVLHVLPKNIVVVLSKALRKAIGLSDKCFTKGSYWAWTSFKGDNISIKNFSADLFMIDLEALQHERHQLFRTYDTVRNHHIYEAQMPRLFKDALPESFYTEPRITITVHPHDGSIKINSVSPLSSEMKRYEKRLMFFRFDDHATVKLNFRDIYLANEKKAIRIPLAKNLDNLESMFVDFFYLSPRDNLRLGIVDTPIATFDIATNAEIVKPQDLLQTLNSRSEDYKYIFTYDRLYKRYELALRNDKFILAMSKSLSSILGFDQSTQYYYSKRFYRANDFPMLSRGITALYVYTNIVDAVYIGDVKAPLLLTCPFKKGDDQKDVVLQQEFLNPTYVPLNRKTIHQIDIGIYDDAGVPVPFLYGKSKLSLHFRRRS